MIFLVDFMRGVLGKDRMPERNTGCFSALAQWLDLPERPPCRSGWSHGPALRWAYLMQAVAVALPAFRRVAPSV